MSPNASRNAGVFVGRSLVEKRHEAIQDLSDIAIYLAEQSGRDSLAFRFIEAAENRVEIIRVLHAKREALR